MTVLALLLVAVLPGAALFRVPLLDRHRRAGLPAEERAFWAVMLSVAWSSAVILALASWHRYTFARLLWTNAGVVMAIVAAFRGRLLLGPSRRSVSRTAWLPLALVVLGAWLFFPPFEHVLGGKDPGVYVNEGVQLAEHGTLVVRDPVVASVPAAQRDLFYPSHQVKEYYGLRFMGFFIVDPTQGTVVGQFPHLFPAWVAVGYAVNGLAGALAATPVAAILGLLAVYFAGARLLGAGAAAAGTAALALNVAMVWFAREPNSEVVAQALLFAALLAFARSQVDGDRFFAPVAAVLYGLLLFARFDMVLALGCAMAATVLQLFDGRRPRLAFAVPILAFAALAWFYLTGTLAPYSMLPSVFLHALTSRQLALIAGGAGAVALLAVASLHAGLARWVRRLAPVSLATCVAGLAVYAYFLRVPVEGALAFGDARSVEIFTWYFPPLALAVALAGYASVCVRRFWRAPALLVTIAVYCVFLFYKLHVVHEHFWAARRFVPVILPAVSLMFASALWRVASARRPTVRWAGTAAATLGSVLLAVALVRADRPIAAHVEYEGAVSRLAGLSRQFTANDLVVFESRDTGSDLHILGLPLAYCWRQPVLVLASPMPNKLLFRQFLDDARKRYRNVYFVGGGGTDLVSGAIASEPVFSDRFQLPEYESRLNAYRAAGLPARVTRKEFDFGIYRMTARTMPPTDFSLQVGSMDDLNVVRFYGKERMSGVPFRWSRRTSYVAVPPLPDAARLTLWMSDGGRPSTVEPAAVVVSINGTRIGGATVTAGFREYSFPIPAAARPRGTDPDEAMLVQLVTSTWQPRAAIGTDDTRDLGVMVQRVEIR